MDNPDDLEAWSAAIRPNTRAFFAETIGNPKSDILDFEGVSSSLTSTGSPLSSTTPSPRLPVPTVPPRCRHRRLLGDKVHRRPRHLDRWRHRRRGEVRLRKKRPVRQLHRARPDYHGLIFSELPEQLRPAQYILKARLQYLRDVGAAIAPLNSFLFLQGLETLSVRMERHVANALAVAKWLEARERGRMGELSRP